MDEHRAALLKSFGLNIRRLRTAKRVSQERLALDAGLHRTEMGKIERGIVEPKLITMMILARGLDVSLDEMVEGLDAPSERSKPSSV